MYEFWYKEKFIFILVNTGKNTETLQCSNKYSQF